MTPFFFSSMKAARLQVIAQAWMGTPFVPHGAIKGAGVDCVKLCAEIYRECGVFEAYDFGKYTMDGGKHLAKSLVTEWVENSGHFFEVKMVDGKWPMAEGDLLCFNIGKVAHHCGIILCGPLFIHAMFRRSAELSRVDDSTFKRSLKAVYRPVLHDV